MNTTKQFMWLFVTLITLACSGWYYSHSTINLIRLDHEKLANSVDTAILNVTVRQFNQQGVLINMLSSPIIHHFEKDKTYLLQKPQILVHQKDESPWYITSHQAKSFEGGNRITFSGNVIVHQKNENKTQESFLKTEEVTYFPKEKKASSDVLVTYKQSGNVVQSTGMNAYLDEKRVELLHKARGSYVPANG